MMVNVAVVGEWSEWGGVGGCCVSRGQYGGQRFSGDAHEGAEAAQTHRRTPTKGGHATKNEVVGSKSAVKVNNGY